MLIIKKIDDWVAKVELFALVFFVASLTLILALQVVLRYVFNSPLFWAEEVAVQLLINITFIGVSYLIYSRKMVQVDFILDLIKSPIQKLVLIALRLTALSVLVVFTYFATDWILRPEIKTDISPTTGLPRWYNYAVVVVSFYLMSWHQFIKLFSSIEAPHHESVTTAPGSVENKGEQQ